MVGHLAVKVALSYGSGLLQQQVMDWNFLVQN